MAHGDGVIVNDALGIVICLILSAFFSSSETALTALSHADTQRLIDDEPRWASSLELWAEKPIEVLTCILIGNNLANITASALATDLAHVMLSHTDYADTAMPVAIGAMTLLLLTFGEITPKTIAKNQFRRVAGPLMAAMRLPWIIFYPFTQLFARLNTVSMKLAGREGEHERPNVTEEDIEYLVTLGAREGTLEQGQEKILQQVFEYTETSVREIMVPRTEMVAIEIGDSRESIVACLIESGVSRLPVYRESLDEIIGLFYVKDMLHYLNETDPAAFNLNELIRPAYFVPELKKIKDQLAEFKQNKVHMAVVVDEFGGTVGLITLEDILEEFFGEIHDEFDDDESHLTAVDSGVWVADARLDIGDAEAAFDVTFPEHPDYDTLAGFIITRSGVVPEPGWTVDFEGLRFEVTDSDPRRVIEVRVERCEDPPDAVVPPGA